MRVLAPVRHGAWVSGSLGKETLRHLESSLAGLSNLRIIRVRGGYIVEANEGEVCLTNYVVTTIRAWEEHLGKTYPTFYSELGPLFAGEVQILLDIPPWKPKATLEAAPEQEAG